MTDQYAPPATVGGAVPRTWTIHLPEGLELINANRARKMHWTKERRIARTIRQASALTARTARIPTLDRVHIAYIVHPKTNGRFDPHNWGPSAKAAVDGLVDAGVMDDDDLTHLIGLEARAGDRVKGGQLSLLITDLSDSVEGGD